MSLVAAFAAMGVPWGFAPIVRNDQMPLAAAFAAMGIPWGFAPSVRNDQMPLVAAFAATGDHEAYDLMIAGREARPNAR